ncbi:hypothetical protein H1R13_28350 [Streptomyces mexicanus]|uniref:NADH:flavin oxidoreductase/NADH oxidase N-terminal domain-containing protein n=1 Tax=Streptomyces mexicanus TaxID=178566 RepID=A0A7X1LT33_9ACTN|nr:hypothetical protein [Streptomyces mexicanus]
MSRLFSPLTLRGTTFPNRAWVAPMCQYSSVDGYPQDWHLVHLGSLARGGSGLVMQEAGPRRRQAGTVPASARCAETADRGGAGQLTAGPRGRRRRRLRAARPGRGSPRPPGGAAAGAPHAAPAGHAPGWTSRSQGGAYTAVRRRSRPIQG